MIGSRSGSKAGFVGAVVGSSSDDEGSVDALAAIRDATSKIACPLSLADWALINSKAPSHTWGFQNASGSITATVGTSLTVTGTPTYAQPVSGWTRKALNIAATTNQRAAFAAGTGPNPATGSVAWFGLVDPTGIPATTGLVLMATDGTPILNVRISSTPVYQVNCNGTVTSGTSNPVTGGVRPVMLVYNKTAGTVTLYTDQDKIVGTYNSGVVDGNKGFGGVGTPCAMSVLLGAAFAGSNAEWSSTEVHTLFQQLGYSPGW